MHEFGDGEHLVDVAVFGVGAVWLLLEGSADPVHFQHEIVDFLSLPGHPLLRALGGSGSAFVNIVLEPILTLNLMLSAFLYVDFFHLIFNNVIFIFLFIKINFKT